MFLSSEQRAKKPFCIPQLNMEVYTLEGLTWYIWHHAGVFKDLLDQAHMIQWVETALGNKALALTLKKGLSDGISPWEWLKPVMSASAYGRSLDLHVLQNRLETMVTHADKHYKQLADEAYAKGDLRGALSLYRQSLSQGYEGDIDNNMGIVYLALGDVKSAMKAFDRCIDRAPKPTYRMNRIRAKQLLGDHQGMLEDLKHLAGLYKDHRVWYYYGTAYEQLGRIEEAMAAYSRCADEGSVKGIKAFARLSYRNGAAGVIDAWLLNHKVEAWLRLVLEAIKLKHEEDTAQYLLCLEQAYESAPVNEKIDIAIELIPNYLERGQIIKALSFLQMMGESGQMNEERLTYYKALIASAAGNDEGFNGEIEALIIKWKGDARRLAVR